MREFYSRWEMGDFRYFKTPAGFFSRTAQKAGTILFFFYGPALFVPLVMFHRVARDRRARFLVVAGVFFTLGLCLSAWLSAHYVAPFVGGLYALLLLGMRHLRAWGPRGRAMVRFLPVLCLLLAVVRVSAAPLGFKIDRWPAMWNGTAPFGLPRAHLLDELESLSGMQLAIVRYSKTHSVFDDWVYNAANVDRSKVVWAREMDGPANAELLKYFSGRRAWLVEPDASPPRISPYPESGR
jgi:hypothetical protein